MKNTGLQCRGGRVAWMASVALALHWPVRTPAASLLPLAHVGLVLLVLVAPQARRAGAVGQFLGALYPVAIVTLLYSEIGLINAAAGRSFDSLNLARLRRLAQ